MSSDINERRVIRPRSARRRCRRQHDTLYKQTTVSWEVDNLVAQPERAISSLSDCAGQKIKAVFGDQIAKLWVKDERGVTDCHSKAIFSATDLLSTITYAGARFSEAPSAKVLPLPPSHWIAKVPKMSTDRGEMTRYLKGILHLD